jgi:hypothetical protein
MRASALHIGGFLEGRSCLPARKMLAGAAGRWASVVARSRTVNIRVTRGEGERLAQVPRIRASEHENRTSHGTTRAAFSVWSDPLILYPSSIGSVDDLNPAPAEAR